MQRQHEREESEIQYVKELSRKVESDELCRHLRVDSGIAFHGRFVDGLQSLVVICCINCLDVVQLMPVINTRQSVGFVVYIRRQFLVLLRKVVQVKRILLEKANVRH